MRGNLTGALNKLAATKHAVAKKARITSVTENGDMEIEVGGRKGRVLATATDRPLHVSNNATVLSTGQQDVYVVVGW